MMFDLATLDILSAVQVVLWNTAYEPDDSIFCFS